MFVGGSRANWWLGSARGGNSTNFANVNNNGNANNNSATNTSIRAAFGFRINMAGQSKLGLRPVEISAFMEGENNPPRKG